MWRTRRAREREGKGYRGICVCVCVFGEYRLGTGNLGVVRDRAVRCSVILWRIKLGNLCA